MTYRMSRRDFLKILGAASVGLALGGLSALGTSRGTSRASAQAYGLWELGGSTHTLPLHVAMLHNGKILYVTGSGFYSLHELGPFEWGIYDTATNTSTFQSDTLEDMFCTGHCVLANGDILFAGGTLSYNNRSQNGKWLGLNGAWIYEVNSNTLRRIQSIKHGRWYPTLVTLGDGKVLVVGGWDEYGTMNRLAEVFDPATETFSIKYNPQSALTYCAGAGEDPAIMPGAGQSCYGPGVMPNATYLYPRMHLMPEGLVVVCGQPAVLRTFNPATGVWTAGGNMLFGARGYGSSCLLPLANSSTEQGKVLAFGGTLTSNDNATPTAEIITLNGTTLQSRWTASLQYGRRHPIPVIMPDGKILVIGGVAYQNDTTTRIMEAELFDPVAETWTTLAPMTVPRQYHSSALLLPDGRVWVCGTSYSKAAWELRVEYFVPYYYPATRPTISGAPAVGHYGETITIPTPEGLDVDAVSLVRMSTETHAGNSDQRLIWLQIQNKTGSEVVVSAPINNKIAPPGYYYVHVLKAGIPSAAAIVKIPGEYIVPPDITSPIMTIESPTEGQVLTGNTPGITVDVTGTASDAESGLKLIEVSVDGGAFAPATGTDGWSFTTPLLTGGPHAITARATDNRDNVTSATVNIEVQLVGSGQFISIYSVAGQNSYGFISSTGSATDTTGIGETLTTSSSLIGSAIKRVAVILKKAGNPTGTINVRIRNVNDLIVKEIGTIDATALTSSDQRFEVTASSGYILQANDKVLVEWPGTGSSADVVHVKRHGVDAFNGASTYYVGRRANGTYATSTGRDIAGDWYYEAGGAPDITPPAIAIESPTEGQVLTGNTPGITVDVTGTASDAESGLKLIEVSVDGGAFAPATGTDGWSFTTPLLTGGPHAITARATDNRDNVSETLSVNINVELIGSGEYINIYSVAGQNSYGFISSTGSATDTTGIGETLTTSSSLIGSAIKRVAVILKKAGNPTGTINVRIRNAGGAIVREIGTIDCAALTAVDQRFEVTASSGYILQANDKVLVEWPGTGSSADVVHVKRHGVDAFNGASTYYVGRRANGTYATSTGRDIAGDWYYES